MLNEQYLSFPKQFIILLRLYIYYLSLSTSISLSYIYALSISLSTMPSLGNLEDPSNKFSRVHIDYTMKGLQANCKLTKNENKV